MNSRLSKFTGQGAKAVFFKAVLVMMFSIAGSAFAGDTNRTWNVFSTRTLQPTVLSLSPAIGNQGSSLAITVNGTGFSDVSSASFSGSGVTVTSVDVVSETQIKLSVTIDSTAALTARTLSIVAGGPLDSSTGATGQCVDCFTPANPTGRLLSIRFVGRPKYLQQFQGDQT